MYKISLVSTLFVLLLGGCSYFTFNASMCEQIASDPQATMPEECRAYSEEEANKAYFNKNKKSFENNESIEFSQ